MSPARVWILLLFVNALSACNKRSDSSDQAASAAASGSAAAAPHATNSASAPSNIAVAAGGWTSNKACALLDRSDAAGALGEAGLRNVKRPENGDEQGSSLVECMYDRGANPGYVKIHIDVPSRADEFGTKYPRASLAKTAVPGIGDAAIQSDDAGMGFILYVKKGNTTFWTQAQTGNKPDNDRTLVQAIAKKAAQRL